MAKTNKTNAKAKVVAKDKKGVTIVDTQTGVQKKLLNPGGKRLKYKAELRDGKHYTNDGKTKVDKKGKVKRLTDVQRAYRSGYIQASIDGAKAYKKKDGQPSITSRVQSGKQPFWKSQRVEAPYPHFRHFKKSGHPALIVGEQVVEDKEEYRYRKVMHGDKDGKRKNETIYPNPNPNDPKPMNIGKRVRHEEKEYFSNLPLPWKYPKK